MEDFLPRALEKGLLMVYLTDLPEGCTTYADIGKVRQVIMNLIENSMEFTPQGSITVKLFLSPNKRKVHIQISDTGVGMSKDTLAGLFNKFVRARNANQVNVGGTGLGLYISKKMMLGMKGKVWAESEGEGKGAQCTVELPYVVNEKSK